MLDRFMVMPNMMAWKFCNSSFRKVVNYMEVSISSSQINSELHAICNAFGFSLSNIFLLCGLFFSLIFFPPYHYGAQGFYIFCIILVFPFIFEHTFQQKYALQEKYKISVFQSIAKKYNYSGKKFQKQWYCFLISCIFLFIWQFAQYLHPSENRFFQIYPSLILVLQIMIRLIVSFWLRLKLHFDLLQNQI